MQRKNKWTSISFSIKILTKSKCLVSLAVKYIKFMFLLQDYRMYSQPSLILKLEDYSRKYGSSMSRVGLTGV